MRRNLSTGLKSRRSANPMRDYDRLPPVLRHWLAGAALPWSARSVHRAWTRALRASGGCEQTALARLDAAEARLLARDALSTWGRTAPGATDVTAPSGLVSRPASQPLR